MNGDKGYLLTIKESIMFRTAIEILISLQRTNSYFKFTNLLDVISLSSETLISVAMYIFS